MQVFRLINGGFPDKLIAFDKLPKTLLANIRTRPPEGLPRYWAQWLVDKGSVCDVIKCVETKKDQGLNYFYTYQKIGQEPCFFILDYQDINNDKEKWRAISEFVRKTVSEKVHLREKLEDMAVNMAPDCYQSPTIDAEDIPVIPIPEAAEEPKPSLIQPGETFISKETPENGIAPKKRGRPKKVIAGVPE